MVTPFLMNLLTNKYFIGISLTVLIVGSVWLRIEYLSGRVDTLRQEKVLLEEAVEGQSKVINRLKVDYDDVLFFNQNYQKRMVELDEESHELRKVLYRETYGKTSLEDLAMVVPEKVEFRINKAAAKVLSELEDITK